jgi:hypothetical protein
VVLAALLLLYAGDWVVLRFRSLQTGQIEIHQYYAVRLKGTAVEYLQGDTVNQTCSHSLLPQMGSEPCWYLSRHRTRRIDYGDTTGSWRDM